MKFNRAKNASRNIIFGIILRLYQTLVPFVLRTVMIQMMGPQYIGLGGLFSSVLHVLNLAELGVGAALVFSMYKPIVENDENTVCALMNLYRKYYFYIGLIVAISGSLIAPFLPLLIKGDVPSGINIYYIYFLNLFATVLSYWLFSYKGSIIQAYQRSDIYSKVALVTSSLQYIIQLIVIVYAKNYYLFILTAIFAQVLYSITISFIVNKFYPQYKPIGTVSKYKKNEINRSIKDLFTSKVGGVIYDSADAVVISAFLGLRVLAVYENYFYILSTIMGFIAVIFSSCISGIGNSIVVESKTKNYYDFRKFTFIICWISCFCATSLLCLYQPFMKIWLGEDFLLSFSAVICLVVYFFVRQINSVCNLYKDAAGIWAKDKYRPLVASVSNLLLNIILVRYIGIYGVLLSTVLAIVGVGMPWLLKNLFSSIFEMKYLGSYLRLIFEYIVLVICICVISYGLCWAVEMILYESFILRVIICLVIPNFVLFIRFRKTKEFSESIIFLKGMLKKDR